MSQESFTMCMIFIAEAEWSNRDDGGYTNNPADPGGETKYGISKKAYPTLDIKNLKKPDAYALYYRDYWLPSGADLLAFPLAAEVFDCAVNQGVGRSQQFLKETDNWRAFSSLRRVFYLDLIVKNPKLGVFKNGWLNRLNRLENFILCHVPMVQPDGI